jgi:hypothetical protein
MQHMRFAVAAGRMHQGTDWATLPLSEHNKSSCAGGRPCVRLYVSGDSFLLNQIRHMVGVDPEARDLRKSALCTLAKEVAGLSCTIVLPGIPVYMSAPMLVIFV